MLSDRNPSSLSSRLLDLLVIGLGPAGVSCALQAQRDGLDVLAIGDEPIGGLLPAARRLDNLAAAPGTSGQKLAKQMADQLAERGVSSSEGQARSLRRRPDGGNFEIGLVDGRVFRARAVCLATGTRPRPWRIPVEGARWFHRDARGLPERLDDARVAVVGGGEAALDTALSARDRGAAVQVLARGSRWQSTARLIEDARRSGVELRTAVELQRARRLGGIWNLDTRAGQTFEVDELIVCIGREARDELARDLIPSGPEPDVVQAGQAGLFLAGDVIRGRERYVATALGDGQRAALQAGRYLSEADER